MSEAKLIAYTQPVAEFSTLDDLGKIVSYCARVSNPSNQMNVETGEKLLNYLFDNAHYSPFEMVNLVIEIKSTRDIVRQLLRHRSFTFQEYSQRYAVSEGFEIREARLQDPKNRQNSLENDDLDLAAQWALKQAEVVNKTREVYGWALDNGIAKEQARAVLPEGNTESTVIVNGTLRSWIHYCMLRMAHGTQKEHIEVATQCFSEISKVFPQMLKFLEKEKTNEG